MSEHHFGLHRGHIDDAKADAIARRNGAWHVNYTDPGTREKRGWFCCRNLGFPFDRDTARAVMADIRAAGLLPEDE